MIWIFAIACVGAVFPHLVYPPLLYVISRFRTKSPVGVARPRVSLVISAFNEADVIRQKLENAISLEYPKDRLEVLVISDASDDATDEIVREYSDRSVSLFRQEERLGKSAGLSRFCPLATGEVLVFTDANSIFRSDALVKLVRHFDNPTIGYTVGRQLYEHTSHDASADSESIYWSVELKLKEWESQLSSVVGADGAIYALRKELFEPLASEDINDFILPLKVVVKGFRGVFDPEAVCHEKAAPDFGGEYRRKYRIVNRSLRAVTKVPQALNPFKVGWFSFQLFSHKVLRWLGPVFLVAVFCSSLWLSIDEIAMNRYPGPFMLFTCGQLLCVGIGISYLLPPLRRFRLVYIAYYYLLVNLAAAVAIGLLLSGRTIGVWKPQR